MNRVFRVVWSRELNAWVVASELAGRHRKGRGRRSGTSGDGRVARGSRRGIGLAAGILFAIAAWHAPLAHAAERYWDPNTGASDSGGTGTWNTTQAIWNSASDGIAGPFIVWNNAALDNAIFAGSTAGIVSLGSPVTVHNITFATANYTIKDGTLTLAGTAPTLTGTGTINSVVAGNGGLTKDGAGTLTLGGANTFTGGVNVFGGTLVVSSDNGLGAAGNGVTLAAGAGLTANAALAGTRVVTLSGATNSRANLRGALGAARFSGTGGIAAASGVTMSNAASDYTGITGFIGGGTYGFTSVADLGLPSALGAPVNATDGVIVVQAGGGLGGTLNYSGAGSQSNRDWQFQNTSSGGTALVNRGTGPLVLTGNIAGVNQWLGTMTFSAFSADIVLSGVLGSESDRAFSYVGSAGQTITLGGDNAYTGPTSINAITVKAPVLADTGTNSSFGAGNGTGVLGLVTLVNGRLSYTGTGGSADRTFKFDGANNLISNDGSGALTLTGDASYVAGGIDAITFGGGNANVYSGVLSGTGNLAMSGTGSWRLDGANTYAGTTTVTGGTLTAGNASALGATKGFVVNGGTLDLNDFSMTAPSLAGTGGAVDLGSGTLTLKSASGSASYAGSIGGSGGLTKLGLGTQTLTGANTYTGATTVGGGTLTLDFGAAGAPASNILGNASALVMSGGTLSVKGASASAQDFGGLTVTAGNNRINATAGSGGTLSLSLGGIARSGGLIDFTSGTGATIATTHADGALGGWATVNGTDYAQVSGGVITAFTGYQNKDDAGQWLNGDIVSDAGGNANTPFANTVNGNVVLGGLKYTALANSTVNVGAGNVLDVDGTILVTSSAGGSGQKIQGGSLSGSPGGGALGVQQNATGTFTVASTITDNGMPTDFTVGGSGTGAVNLTGANTYTGTTTVSGATLIFNTVANGGSASALGASSADASNLLFENGTLRYVGATASTDRGLTLVNGGPSRTIQVDGTANLTFGGLVTSPDDAGFTKVGGGTLSLTNATNDFVGPVVVGGGVLSVATIADGGQQSSLGASASDAANLTVAGGASLQYTGGTTSSDRGFTLSGGPGHVDVAQAATTLTMSGTVVGGGSLVKDGAGTLVLNGSNAYTGGNNVTAGTLRAGTDLAFGGAANGAGAGALTVAGGATADLDGHQVWVTGLNGAGSVALGATTGLLKLRGAGTFTGVISGAGGVSALAGSSQTFSGCGNTYTGPTSIVSGSITTDCLANGGQASGIGASGSAATNLTLNGGWLNYTGSNVGIDRSMQLTGNGGVAVNDASATLTISGTVQGAGQLAKGGEGTLLLTGANTYAGGTRIQQGVAKAGSSQAFGTGTMSIDNTAGATLDLNGFDTTVRSLSGGGTTGGSVLLGGATMSLTGSGNGVPEFAGTIRGSGAVVKGGNYRQLLSGCGSDYAGSTTVSAGTLSVNCLDNGGNASSIGASGAGASNLVLDGGTLQYVGTGSGTDRLFTLGASATSALDASGTGAVRFTNTGAVDFSSQNTAQTVTLTGTSTADNSLAAQITDNGTGKTSLTKTGTGTWILRNADSTYAGVTRIAGGVLGVDHLTDGGEGSSIGASSSAAANLVIGTGATLRYTGAGDTTDRLFTLATGSSVIESSGTGAIVFANTGSAAYTGTGNRTLGLGGTNADLNTMGGTIIDGSGGATTVVKNGTGTWALTGTNTYTGVTNVNGGTLQLGNGGTAGSIASATAFVESGATLAFDRSDQLTLGSLVTGSGGIRQAGSGTTVLTADNTYGGGTTISAGTLQLGNGGTTGSILGDVADNGTLAFDRSDVRTFNGVVSGSGGVTQRGGGTTVLARANTYGGATTVESGTLLVNGNQSAATGDATVRSGATLGGSGTLGGNVTVQQGGALSPGGASAAAGTLTIDGNLSLADGATMNYQLGQPDVVGGSLNDLTVVHGSLDLDGTLNVAATPGGSFGAGLYRIVSYDGTLNDHGLALGTVPQGTYQVQTSVAHQVNLLDSSGITLNFWDGPTGHANGTVDGGSGAWQNDTGNGNWTDPTGRFNAPYGSGQFGIFMGTAGTVTVDDTLGAVTSSGMQFAVDGYRVAGDGITLVAGDALIRVGDGTAAGAGMTATIDAALTGAGKLVKDDLGTLVLDGTNTYIGGTQVNDGVLQVSSDGNLGSTAGPLGFDGGTLRNTGAFVSARDVTVGQGGVTFDTQADLGLTHAIAGAGALTKTGAATLTLGAVNTYTGGTRIDGGTVTISDDANLGDAAGALALDGGTLLNTAAVTSTRDVTLGAGGGTFDTQGDLSLGGGVGGAGGLTKHGGGTLVLSADADYAGGTTINAGTLQLGNGGTAGSLVGDVVNDGTLVFDRSDDLTIGGTVTGGGAIEQQGNGTTVLTGTNSYQGLTAVRAGSLFIDGDQTAATGITSVDAGGTLGGKGLIGGDVTVADGGSLSPGGVGNAPGTLTVKGSLAFSDASGLDVTMGQANVIGGPFNDLVQVGGDLTLDGTLDVQVSSGGSFDPGIYRIIGYAGALTDHGLAIGSVPSPDYFLQTSVAHQVNLLNTAGLDVNFWDGPHAHNDGQVQGGDGVWQNDATNENWTVPDGSVNAPYDDRSFSIFAGTAGTVTVDASLGAVASGGMQFATGGYRIQGDDIALVDNPVVRVGDGTTAGIGMTATIASTLTGVEGLTKSDLGTLVLAGENTYTGNTTIVGGTLQLGEGSAGGSILGDVTDNGTLAFDRSDVHAFDGTVSGSGGIDQRGSGTTVLTADNSYTGTTTVSSGSLRVNGHQSAATGMTSVLAGGTLGGSGSLGGDVSVADGGTLSPGAADGSAGTLTIDGDLTLVAGARLAYQFGQPGTVGGSLNDLTVVHGDLTLDGTLDATTTPGGNFGPGVYRVFSYDGALIDRGLALGSPTTDAFVQTSIAHQVNLVNTTGLTLSFWDGPGHANDGSITGGDGTWRRADNDYWTEPDGAINAPFTDASFAVFAGTPGTVTVDNGNGQVAAGGMQFQTDGYRITGDALMLNASAATVRVGDGTAAGAAVTATIDAPLVGSAMLVKDDLGTLVLSGPNTYTGGTTVHAGTLQVSGDGNLGDPSGGLYVDDATVHTTGDVLTSRDVGLGGAASFDTDTGTTLDVARGITGTGSLTKTGGGTLVLGGASTYGGATTVAGGTLAAALGDAFDASSAFGVNDGATLDLAGFSQHVGSLANAGTVRFGQVPGTTLTVHGDYVGQGGTLSFDAALAGDDSVTDTLVVAGNTSGATDVRVNNVGGAGAQTTKGIKLIDVKGQSNGTFSLKGDYVFEGQQAVVAGAYAYRLYKDGTDGADGDWYLRSALTTGSGDQDPPSGPSPLYQPGVPLYEAYAGMLQQLNTLDTLAQRTGDREWQGPDKGNDMQPGEGLWMRVSGGDRTIRPDTSTSGANYDVSTWKAEAGVDTTLTEGEAGQLVGGATLRYGRNHAGVRSIYGQGRIDIDDYGVGASLTWYGDGGFYADGQARWMRFDSDIRSTTLARMLKGDNKGYGYAMSAELGQRLGLDESWSVVPQAQLSYGNARFDGFNDSFGTRVSQPEGNALTARGGVSIDYRRTYQGMATHVYAIANVYRNIDDNARADVAEVDVSSRTERTWGGLGVGTSLDWGGGRYSVYGEIQASKGGDSHVFNGTAGFRMRW
ncbi:autotransporter outer membrane beta-barrel domain-containing protein [Luteibacter aegosomatis]|uniref:autotransporter-associated beta strand repeat-containing protein n=1 Tax=Luteibacter aegosomatis TaxID=2911537 RepID=UPI001FF817A2|nr:autotransporter-associated beta strand repeat-containing protein [Luteibacter aegosomatis]UPG83981.1 autotransporter outer membrane beta-barrel domain-containing protein [Luteibacter aegosomatis]